MPPYSQPKRVPPKQTVPPQKFFAYIMLPEDFPLDDTYEFQEFAVKVAEFWRDNHGNVGIASFDQLESLGLRSGEGEGSNGP